ncbi:hypothetical protein [Allocoleopsis sp.]|uniref:hypothetical protein n=1 Tax=Allocoleopsis sp. TaxID=3088169 RepID=UPI002FCF6B0D
MGRNRGRVTLIRLISFLIAAVLTWGLVSCSGSPGGSSGSGIETPEGLNKESAKPQLVGQLSEVAPPPAIQKLSQTLEAYQPQVVIISPRADQVLLDTTVSVQFQVQDLPIFKDPDLGLGPHLHVILDNQPYQAVYDLDKPIVFEDLAPGTHTLRVFASRPWHESFKNEGAYAQTSFHVFTKSTDNNPDPALPLLSYSRPTGSYGAEPIMLDFYLTNAPLHLVAQENPNDDIADWRIRATINGESFVLDRWQSIYLKGFKRGKNWVKLEFLDEQGNPVKNVFNNTVRLINYEPKGKDTLSKLVRGELSAEAARGIVDPNYKTTPTLTPSPAVTPSPTPSPTVTPEPIPSVAPSVEEAPTPKVETPSEEPTPPVESSPTPGEPPAPVEEPIPTAPVSPQKPRFGGLLNRFRRPAAPSPAPERSEPETPTPAPAIAPEQSEQTPQLETPTPAPAIAPEEPEQTPEPEASPTPSEAPAAVEEATPTEEATPNAPVTPKKSRFGGLLNRFRRPAATSNAPSTLPEVLDTPSTEPTVIPEKPERSAETTPQPEDSAIPSKDPSAKQGVTPTTEPVKPEAEANPIIEPVPVRPIQPEKSAADSLPPTLPEIVGTPVPEPAESESSPAAPEEGEAPTEVPAT